MATHLPDPDPRLLLPKIPTLHDEWLKFEQLVVATDAGAVQRQEMRRAWYGGVQTLMAFITEPGLNEAKLEAWRRELNYFVRLVQRGQA